MSRETLDACYDVVAIAGILLSMYVMQAAERDRINRVDPKFLCAIRRFAFIVVALALCNSILDEDWVRSFPVILMVFAGDCNLAVNAIALHMRVPRDGHRAHAQALREARRAQELKP